MTPGTTPSEFGARRHRGQLPAEVTGFVGRGSELSWLATLLDGARLITVVGPGGVGKTRVALRAAARAADDFPDGVRLVELSGLRDPALLPNAVASCLGLVEQDDRPQLAAVLDHLRTRRLLLILDTCEHLVDACALLAEAVLRQTAAVTVLATSRQPLDVPGEHTFRLQPLPVPGLEEEATAAAGDAVELFAQRALAAVPGFAVTAANRADVIRLCRRLDGIPLAIELAAVRLRALPLPELTDRLENRFHVLTGERRGTVSRHQTLHTAIEWSYSLCTPAERALWDRLSVFAGNFDVAAAEDVGACDMVPRDRVLQVLISLVDKSVVLRDGPDGPPGPRYRLLDSLREFAAERLAESGQEADCRARHIARYLAMARRFGRNFADDDQLARLRQLRAEHDNIRAALEYAFAGPGSGRDAAGLACVLYSYWHISGSLREGAYWLDKVLDTFPGPAPSPSPPPSPSPSPERASALIDRALIGSVEGHPEAVARAREGIEIAALLGDERLSARGYLALNLALTFAGYHDEAVDAGVQARRRLSALDSRVGLICLDAQMGLLYQLSGKFDQSVESCQHGLRGLAPGERWLRSYLHVVSAVALYQQPGKEAECAEALRQGLAAKHELGDYVGGAYALEALAWLAADAGRCERTSWLLGAAHSLWERAGTRLGNNAIMEEFHQRAAAKAGEALGAERFDALHAAGAAQPIDRIVALAIGDADSLTAGSGAGSRDREAGGLTKREQQIASLVASGLSNREIAEKLVISKRTVDAHVDHIFAKLGISSRVQLTVWLREQLPRARPGELTRF
jgi:predicted ATPase/DNA-binding CsgD family transcriptional regulator